MWFNTIYACIVDYDHHDECDNRFVYVKDATKNNGKQLCSEQFSLRDIMSRLLASSLVAAMILLIQSAIRNTHQEMFHAVPNFQTNSLEYTLSLKVDIKQLALTLVF